MANIAVVATYQGDDALHDKAEKLHGRITTLRQQLATYTEPDDFQDEMRDITIEMSVLRAKVEKPRQSRTVPTFSAVTSRPFGGSHSSGGVRAPPRK